MQDQLHIRDYVNVLEQRKNIIIIFFVTLVAVVTLGSFIIKPTYEATVTLLIDLESPAVLTTSGIVALESQNYYSYKEYYQSQVEILTSRSIAQRVFEECDLAASKKYAKAKDPTGEFLKTINVEPVRDTRLLKLKVDNKNPALAAKIANRVADIYVKRNLYYISREELMNLLKNEYLKLETRSSEFSKVYKNDHPKMARLKEEIAEMVKRIENVKESTFDSNMSEINLEGEYQDALQGLKANNISIQDPAEVPVIPIKPKKKLNILLAMLIGIFGGVGLAFFIEYMDDTIKNLDGVKGINIWPFLGGVPEITDDKEKTEFKKDLLSHLKPQDPTAESYKAIRTRIFFSSTEEHPIKTILITSPGPQEGKTTTLCNLGIAIAQTGKSVLFVDADMRRPRLHGIFKIKNEKGLSDYLCSMADFDEVIKKSSIEGISLIPGGTYPPNPSELLSSHKMNELVDKTKSKFDFVLFDTPPVAVVTDAVVLSKFIDGAILVIESGKTSKRIIPRVIQVLEDAKTKVIGTILNKISISNRSYHYYYYANYYGMRDKSGS